MRSPLLALLVLLTACHAQTGDILVSPDIIIPNPRPAAPLSDWKPAQGRSTLSLTVEGATLRGFRYTGTNPTLPTILFFNGNAMTIGKSDSLYRAIAALGPTVIAYDYRGYGFSTGESGLFAFRADAKALYDEAAKSAAQHRVIVYGYSMGTAVGTYLATQKPATALILAAPIATAAEEFPVYARAVGYSADQVSHLRYAPEANEIFGEAKLIQQFKAPLLIVHGTADALVPMQQGQEIFAASPSADKKFVPLEGVPHSGAPGSPDALNAVSELLHRLRP